MLRITAATLALMLSAAPAVAQGVSDPREVRVVRHVTVTDGSSGEAGLDRDGDGFLTREEFLAPLVAAWERLDRDGEGRIPVDALRETGRTVTSDGEERHVLVFRTSGGEPVVINGADGETGTRVFTLRRAEGSAGTIDTQGGPIRIEVRRSQTDGADVANVTATGSSGTRIILIGEGDDASAAGED